MAQTRTITRRKLAVLGLLDFASRPIKGVWPAPPPLAVTPKSFLLIELWGIGDVVLATTALAALRQHFPDAHLALLAKPHAVPLLQHSGLVDEVIPFDFPWTAFTGKWHPKRYDAARFKTLFAELRARHFDVSLDARRDIRSNLVAYVAGAKRRIGYDFGGGAHLLTDVIPSGDQNEHKTRDWLTLLAPLGISEADPPRPRLTVTDQERRDARARLSALGLNGDKRIVGIHPGASLPQRTWGDARFDEARSIIRRELDVDFVLFEEKRSDVAVAAGRADNAVRLQTTLREFMALVTQCDLLLCNDSGPMHIASALDVPVTALFGSGRKEWYGPTGELDSVVQMDMPCRPCFDACIFATRRCLEGITTREVATAVLGQLDRIAQQHASVR